MKGVRWLPLIPLLLFRLPLLSCLFLSSLRQIHFISAMTRLSFPLRARLPALSLPRFPLPASSLGTQHPTDFLLPDITEIIDRSTGIAHSGEPSSHLTTARTHQKHQRTFLRKRISARSYRRQGGSSSEGEMEIGSEMVGEM